MTYMVSCRKRYTDSLNQAVMKKVLAETRSLDPYGPYDAKVQKRRKNRLTKVKNM